MMRWNVLKKICPPWYPEEVNVGNVGDGLFMNKVAATSGIFPVFKHRTVEVIRSTELSSHTRSTLSGGIVFNDWRKLHGRATSETFVHR